MLLPPSPDPGAPPQQREALLAGAGSTSARLKEEPSPSLGSSATRPELDHRALSCRTSLPATPWTASYARLRHRAPRDRTCLCARSGGEVKATVLRAPAPACAPDGEVKEEGREAAGVDPKGGVVSASAGGTGGE
jgi:hypothetical protein